MNTIITYDQFCRAVIEIVRTLQIDGCGCGTPSAYKHLFFNYSEIDSPNLGADGLEAKGGLHMFSSTFERHFSEDENKVVGGFPLLTVMHLNTIVQPRMAASPGSVSLITNQVNIGIIDVIGRGCKNDKCKNRTELQVMLDARDALLVFLSYLNDLHIFELSGKPVIMMRSKYEKMLESDPLDPVLTAMIDHGKVKLFGDEAYRQNMVITNWTAQAGGYVGAIAIEIPIITASCDLLGCEPSDPVSPLVTIPTNPQETQTLTVVAGENISSGRAVIIENGLAYYFEPSNVNHAGQFVGIALLDGLTGEVVEIQTSGIVSNNSYSFSPNSSVYIGEQGTLQTDFTTIDGVLQKVGVVVETNKILITQSVQVLIN